MTPSFTVMEKIVGLFILLTFLSFLGSVALVGRGQHWFQRRITYYAFYLEGYNLQAGVKVKFLRTNIGYVTDVSLTDDNRVKVAMSIFAEYASRITEDSEAAIESPTIIGSEFINIIPGKALKKIPPGGTIKSREAKKISAYLEEFEFAHKMEKLDDILENLADITAEIKKPDSGLLGAVNNLEKITAAVAEGEGTIGQLIGETVLHDEIMERLTQVKKILDDVQAAAASIKTGAASIETGAGSIQKSAGSAEQFTSEIEKQIPALLNQVQAILKNLDAAMNDLPSISKKARRELRSVDNILESVKKNFLIRGNLPRISSPGSLGVEMRGD